MPEFLLWHQVEALPDPRERLGVYPQGQRLLRPNPMTAGLIRIAAQVFADRPVLRWAIALFVFSDYLGLAPFR